MSKNLPQQILQQYWGYPDFRPGQIEIVNHIVSGHDTLAILPTGGGKSICFQVPGLILPGTTLVISPLISLMKDQVDQLQKRQISAIFLDSSYSPEQMRVALEKIKTGIYKFIYASPERLLSYKFIQLCQSHEFQISLIAVDEAHCISLWGHDFRPSFLQIKDFLDKLTYRPPIAAFTATTTEACTHDIVKYLNLNQPQIFQKSFARENLFLNVVHCQGEHEKKFNLLRLLKKHHGQAGIIYALTRDKTESLARWLNKVNQLDKPVVAYHGALDKVQRAQIQDDFITNKTSLIIATNAFGMGVDKPDIDFVIHYQPSANIENYYQEVGRAGRAGQRGDCYLLLYQPDWEISEQFIQKMPLADKQELTLQRQKILYHKLKQMQKLTQLKKNPLNHQPCRQNFILNYFQPQTHCSSSTPTPCQHCDLCTQRSFTPSSFELQALKELKKIRKHLARQLHPQLAPELLLPLQLLRYIVLCQPQTLDHLKNIPGFGRGLLNQTQITTYLLDFSIKIKQSAINKKLLSSVPQ